MGPISTLNEVPLGERAAIADRYAGQQHVFPLILAVLAARQPGQVLRSSSKGSIAVLTKFGFMQTVGPDKDEAFDTALSMALSASPHRYLLWYAPPERWQRRFNDVGDAVVRRRERIRLGFRRQQHAAQRLMRTPPGCVLKMLDANLLASAEGLGVELASRFWPSAEVLLREGISVCAVKENQVISLCYSACVVAGLAEVDIVTAHEYRGQQLGTACAQRFIKECMSRGIMPTWDCFANNIASLRLAARLGFEEVRRYPLYSFNTPLSIKIP